jgi:hypothetical protein
MRGVEGRDAVARIGEGLESRRGGNKRGLVLEALRKGAEED